LEYDGLAVDWLAGAPTVTAVAGTATFTGDVWELRVARGRVAGLTVIRARLALSALASAAPRIGVEGAVRGPPAGALAIVDAKPIGVATALGVAPGDAAGTVDGRVSLATRLDRPPDLAQLGLDVHADLRDVGVPRIGPGWPLAGGDLTLSIARQ